MKKKTMRFLWISLACVLVLGVGVFTWINTYMLRESRRAINEVGEIYMAEMNRQMRLHFRSITDLCLSQVEGIVWRTPPESVQEYGEEMLEELAVSAEIRGFSHLSIYSTQGEFNVIYGEPLTIINEEPFLQSLNQGEKKVTVGRTASGAWLLLFGVSVGYPESEGYPMQDGSRCTALVAGLPMEYLNETMDLKMDGAMIYSHIISKEGWFVVRNADIEEDNYYDRIVNRCTFEGQTAQEALNDLKSAVSAGKEYTTVLTVDGEQRHLYCSPLPDSEWYLVTVMPHGILDETVARLGTQRVNTALGGGLVILAALLTVFFLYFRMTQRQLTALERAQREAERANQAKSEFLSNMSHDIRTPMNAIVGMTAIAAANISKPEQVQDCLRKISLSSKHLLGLINDVLDMSKIESGKLTLNVDRLSLREAMESIVSIVQPQVKAKGQSFDIFIRDIQTEQVRCDGLRLNQVLLNLLSNALKFTPEGGAISVTLTQEDSPRGGDYVRTHFWVEDTGIGMSPEFQKRIFDSFMREDNQRVQKIEGTGLGMTITKYIVDEMKGTIELKSEVDKGTQFHVTLDLERAREREEDMVLPDWEMLVVDDDEQLCASAADVLREIGVHAQWALDGKSAVEMAEKRHAQGRDYHVVLLDWKMPGMDGIETARQLRKTVGEDIPLLLISAYDWSEIEDEARRAGINGFIAKPLFKSTLFYGLNHFAHPGAACGPEEEEQAPDYTGKRILLAEDNELNWEIASELLSSVGFTLEWAENGRICVEKFMASEPGFYHAVLMDLRMPVMNGYEATRAIRTCGRADADVPIIAMTADAFSEDIQKCLECGMNAHVAKPLDVRELLRLLQRLIRQ